MNSNVGLSSYPFTYIGQTTRPWKQLKSTIKDHAEAAGHDINATYVTI